MIKIKTNNIHSKEKHYILETIFSDILGLKIAFESSEEKNYVIELPNKNKIIIPDKFLSSQVDQKKWEKYEYPESSFNTNIKLKNNHSLFGIYGCEKYNISDNTILIENDIIGTSFIFLSRIEELNNNQDKFGRYQFKYSLADRFNIITRPVVNEYINFIKDSIIYLCPSLAFKKNEFKIILSHDIDSINKWSWKNLIKHAIYGLFKKDYLKKYLDYFHSKMNFKKDPFYNFNRIMNISESKKLNSLFLFMALEKNEFDYRYPLKKIIPAINEIKKRDNHNFGIHISKLAYNDLNRCSEEISRLSKISKSKIIYSRQHYLMFDPKKTWAILNANGIKYDLSLGYPEMPGFRCGICYPFKTFDIVEKKKLDLIEIPLIVMDVSILDYLKGVDFDIQLKKILKNVRKYDGLLNVLWHNDQFDSEQFKKNRNLFYSIIKNDSNSFFVL